MNAETPMIVADRRPLGHYVRRSWPMRRPALGYVALASCAAAYGLTFALYGGVEEPAPFMAPLGVMIGVIFWIMPEIANPPVRWISRLFVGFIFALLCWPDYIALALPGLPWITAIRLFGTPLLTVLLICAFGSKAFREQMKDILSGDKVIVGALVAFFVIAGLSIGLSKNIGSSSNRYFVAVMAWGAVFFAGAYFFSKAGNARRFSYFLFFASILSLAIGLYEARYSQLPWKDRIPYLLAIEDPRIEALLAGTVRAASGIYRVQSKFSTSIGLGEFFGFALPFLLHIFMTTRKRSISLLIMVLLPPMGYIVVRTDSRLAFISFVSSLILYVAFAAADRWKNRRDSLFAPAILLVYPAFLAGFIALSIFWRRLTVMIWGGGAASFSTQSREAQVDKAIPMIFHNPFGYGIGQGPQTLGYIAPGSDMFTVDSYFLSVGLEYGVIGFLVYYGMFVWAIVRAGMVSLDTRDADVIFLAPTAIALVNFMISKSIYSQQESHPLAFILLGLVVALLRRHRDLKVQVPAARGVGYRAVPAIAAA